MVSKPEVVADNEVPAPEPEGFWEAIHREVRNMRATVLAAAQIVLDDDDD